MYRARKSAPKFFYFFSKRQAVKKLKCVGSANSRLLAVICYVIWVLEILAQDLFRSNAPIECYAINNIAIKKEKSLRWYVKCNTNNILMVPGQYFSIQNVLMVRYQKYYDTLTILTIRYQEFKIKFQAAKFVVLAKV